MLKKVLYFIPCILMTILALIASITNDSAGMLLSFIIIDILPTAIAGVLLSKNKAWGAWVGVFYAGIVLAGFSTAGKTGPTANMPLWIAFAVWYAICAWLVSNDKKLAKENKSKK